VVAIGSADRYPLRYITPTLLPEPLWGKAASIPASYFAHHVNPFPKNGIRKWDSSSRKRNHFCLELPPQKLLSLLDRLSSEPGAHFAQEKPNHDPAE
jgi:hypothetical protein